MEEFGIFRTAAADGFEGEGCGIEQFEFDADVVKEVICLLVEGIFFEFLFNEREGSCGIFFCMTMEFHDAHAAGGDAEKSTFLFIAAGELEFAFAEQFATFQKSLAFLEDALQE